MHESLTPILTGETGHLVSGITYCLFQVSWCGNKTHGLYLKKKIKLKNLYLNEHATEQLKPDLEREKNVEYR